MTPPIMIDPFPDDDDDDFDADIWALASQLESILAIQKNILLGTAGQKELELIAVIMRRNDAILHRHAPSPPPQPSTVHYQRVRRSLLDGRLNPRRARLLLPAPKNSIAINRPEKNA